MIYKEFRGEQLSMLALGAMRLPVIDGDNAAIDQDATNEMVDYALEQGVNYFDTAWGYHGGQSEPAMGRALGRHPRGSFYLATKFPGYDVRNFGKHEEIFAKQLERTGVEAFDFYLIHNVNESNIEQYLDDEAYGTVPYFVRQQELGRIRHLGFSVHGDYDVFSRFLDAYGEHMEFCQIQLNYLDWSFQDARAKVERCQELGIPVWVMEPLRGGHLCSLEDEQAARLDELRPGVTPTEWAFRWLEGVEGVTEVLSGMSNMRQLRKNIATFSSEAPLNEEEQEAIARIAREMATAKGLACTACSYCVPHCPMELDIPQLISLYNEHLSKDEGGFIAPMRIAAMPEDKRPNACIACGACSAVCPQALAIPEAFEDFSERLGL